jgi:hypothetical protein
VNSLLRSSLLTLLLVLPQILHAQSRDQLWPEIEAFQTGFMQVSEIHEIYFEQCGNPDGVPVFVLHGGSWGTTLALAHRHDTKPVPHAWIKTVRTC